MFCASVKACNLPLRFVKLKTVPICPIFPHMSLIGSSGLQLELLTLSQRFKFQNFLCKDKLLVRPIEKKKRV